MWNKDEESKGERGCCWVGGVDRMLLVVPLAPGKLLGLAPGVPFSRESPLLVPYQRVCVHLWGAIRG